MTAARVLTFAPRQVHPYHAECTCRTCARELGVRTKEFAALILSLRNGKPYPLRFS